MENEKKYALLIDADNISPKYIDMVMKETVALGVTTFRRIYADWTDVSKESWKKVLLDYSLMPIQQYSYTYGKNSSDSAMIIDAMDILYTGDVDGFILVTSDSDFTRLASRLRESGKQVIGMGESKTPAPFVKACEQFKTLDLISKGRKKSAAKAQQSAKDQAAKGQNAKEQSAKNQAGKEQNGKTQDAQAEKQCIQADKQCVQDKTQNMQTIVQNVQPDDQNVQLNSQIIQLNYQNIQPDSRNVQTEAQNPQPEAQNPQNESQTAESQPDEKKPSRRERRKRSRRRRRKGKHQEEAQIIELEAADEQPGTDDQEPEMERSEVGQYAAGQPEAEQPEAAQSESMQSEAVQSGTEHPENGQFEKGHSETVQACPEADEPAEDLSQTWESDSETEADDPTARTAAEKEEPEIRNENGRAVPITSLEEIRSQIMAILEERSDDDGWMFLGDVGNMLIKSFPDFDARNYGYKKVKELIDDIHEVEVRSELSSNRRTRLVYIKSKEKNGNL